MKVLVLSCSTGGGHNSCGKYIKEELNANEIECDFVDYFSILGKKISNKVEKIYLKSTSGSGKIFKEVYKLGETYNKVGLTSPVYELNKLSKNKLLEFITENHYDLVICPHLFPAMAITYIKKTHPEIPLINVATDYTNIPFWNETKPDYFVIPHESLKKEFTEKGIDEKVLLPLGIPVATSFRKKKVTLELQKKIPNILVTSGSMGFGKIKEIVKSLSEKIDAQIIVVCGSNEKLKKSLENLKNPKIIALGFINNMNEYMKSCDVVLTKPGGLTSTEVAVLNKPMIHIMPIPGVENHNASFFEKNKLSIVCNTKEEIIENTKRLLEQEEVREEMLESQRNVIHENAAEDLVDFIKKRYMKKQ